MVLFSYINLIWPEIQMTWWPSKFFFRKTILLKLEVKMTRKPKLPNDPVLSNQESNPSLVWVTKNTNDFLFFGSQDFFTSHFILKWPKKTNNLMTCLQGLPRTLYRVYSDFTEGLHRVYTCLNRVHTEFKQGLCVY